MSFDNRIFNVKGRDDDALALALNLVFMQQGQRTTCKGWTETKKNGLILTWYESDGAQKLPAPMSAEQCMPMIGQWLCGDFAKTVDLGDMCGNADHDGDNGIGWQVYCEAWGHVGDISSAIGAIRPAYLWFGK